MDINNRRVARVSCLLILAMAAVGCSSDDVSDSRGASGDGGLVGRWEPETAIEEKSPFLRGFALYADGTVVANGDEKGSWKVEDGRLVITLNFADREAEHDYDYALEGTTLTLSNAVRTMAATEKKERRLLEISYEYDGASLSMSSGIQIAERDAVTMSGKRVAYKKIPQRIVAKLTQLEKQDASTRNLGNVGKSILIYWAMNENEMPPDLDTLMEKNGISESLLIDPVTEKRYGYLVLPNGNCVMYEDTEGRETVRALMVDTTRECITVHEFPSEVFQKELNQARKATEEAKKPKKPAKETKGLWSKLNPF